MTHTRLHDILRCAAWSLCAAVCVLMSSVEAAAQPVTPAPHRVAVSPTFYLMEDPEAVQPVRFEGREETGAVVERSVRRYIAGHPEVFEYITGAQILRRIERQPLYTDRLGVARDSAKNGLNSYKELELQAAIGSLERALENYTTIHYDLVDPDEVAEVILYLALSHLERGDRLQADRLFRRMILLTPERELREGYYPDNVVQTYHSAREYLREEVRTRGLPAEMSDLADRLTTLMEMESMVFGFVVPAASGPQRWQVRLLPWSRREGPIARADTMVVETLDAARLREAGSRLAARWADCVREPVVEETGPVKPARGTSPLSVDVGFSYGTYLRFPRLKPLRESLSREDTSSDRPDTDRLIRHFNNYGLNVAVGWALRQEFALFGRFQLLVSQRDYSWRIEDVSTVRGMIGGEFGLQLDRFRLGLQLAADLTHLDDFTIRLNLECPQRPGEVCNKQVYDEHGVQLGLNVTPLVTYKLYSALEVVAQTSLSYFFYSSDSDAVDEVNLPLTAEIGLRYRF